MVKQIIKKILPIVIIMCIAATMFVSIFKHFESESQEVQSQEQISDRLAEEYLINIKQQEESQPSETIPNEEEPSLPSDLEYDDNEIYSYFDESYAHGKIDCVLEIPSIDLRQSVFTGTVEQIEHDLSRWLPVTARTDYILGSTHYCIYMHNPRDKSIQISKAQECMKIDDYMIVTKEQYVYFYRVSNIFAEWRNKCSDMYVNNMATSADKLYIFTCGRGEWQGRNLVIEGTIYDVYKTSEWINKKDEIIAQYKTHLIDEPIVEPENKGALLLDLQASKNNIIATLKSPNFTQVDGCLIGIVNEDGQAINGFEKPLECKNGEVTFQNLQDGTYYIGVYDNNTEFADPLPYKVTVGTNQITITDVVQENQEFEDESSLAKKIAISSAVLTFIFGIVLIVKIVISEIKNKL
jgi:sortase (surface protein transpeptidase)